MVGRIYNFKAKERKKENITDHIPYYNVTCWCPFFPIHKFETQILKQQQKSHL